MRWFALGALAAALVAQWALGGGRAMAEAGHVYDGCGSLCYMGGFYMAAQDLGTPYETFVRYGNPAGFESGPGVLDLSARRLGYALEVSGLTDKDVTAGLNWFRTTGRKGRTFGTPREAERALEASVRSGRLASLHVDLYYLLEDRRRISPRYPDVGHAGHNLVVTGYDRRYFYVHDPQMEGPIARYQPLPRESLMAAWQAAGCRMEQPVKIGGPEPDDKVLREVMEPVPVFLDKARQMADRMSKETGPIGFSEHLNLSSVPYRRQVLSAWLGEHHLHRAAELSGQASKTYGRIDVQTPSKQAATLLEAGIALDQQAYQAWTEETAALAAGSPCSKNCPRT